MIYKILEKKVACKLKIEFQLCCFCNIIRDIPIIFVGSPVIRQNVIAIQENCPS